MAYGTYPLYEGFPDAQILLVDPLSDHIRLYDHIVDKYGAQIVMAAAGAKPGKGTFIVYPLLVGLSFYVDKSVPPDQVAVRETQIVTLDGECRQRNLNGPYLIKLDVQGAELNVLEGPGRSLPKPKWSS